MNPTWRACATRASWTGWPRTNERNTSRFGPMWLLYSPAPSNDGPVRGDELRRAAAITLRLSGGVAPPASLHAPHRRPGPHDRQEAGAPPASLHAPHRRPGRLDRQEAVAPPVPLHAPHWWPGRDDTATRKRWGRPCPYTSPRLRPGRAHHPAGATQIGLRGR